MEFRLVLFRSLKDANGRILLFDFAGPLSFGAAADLVHIVRRRSKREVRAIVLDFSRKVFADRSAVQAIKTIVSESVAKSDESLVVKECVSTCSYRWSQYH